MNYKCTINLSLNSPDDALIIPKYNLIKIHFRIYNNVWVYVDNGFAGNIPYSSSSFYTPSKLNRKLTQWYASITTNSLLNQMNEIFQKGSLTY